MAKLFLSHSSADKPFVRRLANDLIRGGHSPWLDEWEILIGESITSRVQEGLRDADYVIVVLSPQSVRSGWVDREWQARYGSEISAGKAVILPVLMEPCELPMMLRDKRYANFHQDYERGLEEVLMTLSGVRGPSRQNWMTRELRLTGGSALSRLLDGRVPLSASVADVMIFAQSAGLKELSDLCANELRGWPELSGTVNSTDYNPAPYRVIKSFVTVTAEVDPEFIGWGGDISRALRYMEGSDDFAPFNLMYTRPLSEIESSAGIGDKSKAIAHVTFRANQLMPNTRFDGDAHVYFAGDALQKVLSAIRTRIAGLLTAALA